MQLSLLAVLLAVGGGSAAALPSPSLAPALPLSAFETKTVKPLTLEEILANVVEEGPSNIILDNSTNTDTNRLAAQATCSNPRIRTEWDAYSNDDRQAFVNAINCLIAAKPSGRFSQAKNRYEDLVALHQTLTDNVHGNSKFLIWHRYFLWTFEDLLRSECGFDRNLPWFDETKYAGKFSSSSIFTSSWFGGIAIGGNCVEDGVSN